MFDTNLLHQEVLTKAIQEFKDPNLTVKESGTFPEVGEQGQERTWDILKANRTLADVVGKHSPSVSQKLEVIGQGNARLARSYENQPVPGSVLIQLRNPGSTSLAKGAAQVIARELKKLNDRIERRDEQMLCGALQGSFDITIHGVTVTVDYKFSASHKCTIGGAQIDAQTFAIAWSDPGADIKFDVMKVQQKVMDDSGQMIRTAIISPEIKLDLMNNVDARDFLKQTAQGEKFVQTGEIDQMWGLNWRTVRHSFKPEGGSVTRFWPSDTVSFLPEPSTDVAYMSVGSDYIPTEDRKNMQEVIGKYAYAAIKDDPVAVLLYAGKVRIPIIAIPDAFLKAVVR
jgi:hypothetical protein